jgi:large subunit ribosomal protein L35
VPKLKTHRGAAKRFRKTARGKFLRGHSFLRHILTSKDRKRKRHLRRRAQVSREDAAQVRRMLPYYKKM